MCARTRKFDDGYYYFFLSFLKTFSTLVPLLVSRLFLLPYYINMRRRPGDNTSVVVVVNTAAAAIRVRGKRFASAAAMGSEVLAYRLKV